MNSAALFSMRLSMQVAAVATLFVVLAGVPLAYLLARRNFRGKELIDIACTLPLVMPPTVTGYYLIVLFGRNGLLGRYISEWTGFSIMFTWYAAALASFVVSLPLMTRTARAAFESVDSNLINASFTLGRSELSTAFHVVLPLAGKGIVAGAVLAFARSIGEFGATLMIAGNLPGKTDTMPIAIYSLANGGEWSEARGMVLLLTGMSALFLFAANLFTRRVV